MVESVKSKLDIRISGYLFKARFRTALWRTYPLIQWIPKQRRPVREDDYPVRNTVETACDKTILYAVTSLTSSVACSSSRGQRAEGELRGFLYTLPSSSTSSDVLMSSAESRGTVRWERFLEPAGNLPLRLSATTYYSHCSSHDFVAL